MNKDKLCVGARAAMGDHTCTFLLRPVGEIPGGLWSWLVYVDGNVHAGGPGSKRKDPIHWYATLLEGLIAWSCEIQKQVTQIVRNRTRFILRSGVKLNFLLKFHSLMMKLI